MRARIYYSIGILSWLLCANSLGQSHAYNKAGQQWLFQAEITEENTSECLGLTLLKRECLKAHIHGIMWGQRSIGFHYMSKPNTITSSYTGVVLSKKASWIHPYFSDTVRSLIQNAPFPMVTRPPVLGNSYYGGQYPGHMKGPLEEPDSSLFSQWTYTITAHEEHEIMPGYEDDVWVIEAEGGITDRSERWYTCEFWWHQYLGFVRFKYLLHNGNTVNLSLLKAGKFDFDIKPSSFRIDD